MQNDVLSTIFCLFLNRCDQFLVKKKMSAWFKNDNSTLLKITENVYLDITLEHYRDSDKRVSKPLNLIFIYYLFSDLSKEGVLTIKVQIAQS